MLKNQTVQEVFQEYIKANQFALKKSTIAHYSTTAENHLLYCYGNKAIANLTESLLIEFIYKEKSHNLSNNTKELSDKTMYDLIILINALWDYAFVKGYTKHKINILPPRIYDKPISVFSDSEIACLYNYVISDFDFVGLGVLLSLFCGLRIGEVCALQWQDINFDSGIIKIRKTILRVKNFEDNKSKTKIMIDTPKTESSLRDVPIPEFVLSLLVKYRGQDDWYVLTAGLKYMEPRILQAKYKKLLEVIGIPYKNYHVLRHTFATMANNKGMDAKTLSELLGHKRLETTLKKYVHPDLAAKKLAVDRIFQSPPSLIKV